ncbi:MAG: CPBP family glutamic-type intramembrane protease [Natronomonas sp.]|nr:CPBP family glutamic-type intramembrane protease [Natronomonas sp.]
MIGAVFGALYERTGNLAVPILVHAVYNVVLLAISYLAVVYG